MDEQERNTNGTWKAGHKSTGGRKSVLDEDEKKRLMTKAIPLKRRLAILDKLGAMAEKGNIAAIKLVLEYLYGKPVDVKEISSEEGIKLIVRWLDGDQD